MNNSEEDELTCLIETLFDWLEIQSPGFLNYGNVAFRGALERFFYFSCSNNPGSLEPLLTATFAWRVSCSDAKLAAVYDKWLVIAQAAQASKAKALIRCMLNLCHIYWFGYLYLFTKRVKPAVMMSQPAPVGFFAINSRLACFFSDIVNKIKPQPVVFFSDSDAISKAVDDLRCGLAKTGYEEVSLKNIAIPFNHALFPAYINALKKYLKIAGMLNHTQPAVLVFSEGTSMEDDLAARAASQLKIPTLRVQSGRAGVIHPGYKRMVFDKMLCWGEGFIERYKKYSPGPEYLAVGSPLLDDFKRKSDVKSFVMAVLTQPVSTHISIEDYLMLSALTSRVVREVPDIQVLVRKHPVDASLVFDDLCQQYPHNIKMMCEPDWTLKEVMQLSDAALGFYSTTLSEAAACEVVPIILKLKDQHSVFPFPESHGAAVLANNCDDVFNAVMQLCRGSRNLEEIKNNMRLFRTKYFGKQDDQALNRIVDLILLNTNKQDRSPDA